MSCCVPTCCGACDMAMSTSQANASVRQDVCGNCGGAGSLSCTLNAIGKWGTVLTATAQGKAVQTGSTIIGARGATSLPGQLNGTTIFLIVAIGLVLLFVSMRR